MEKEIFLSTHLCENFHRHVGTSIQSLIIVSVCNCVAIVITSGIVNQHFPNIFG